MFSIKGVFLILILVNIMAILLISVNQYHGGSLQTQTVVLQEKNNNTSPAKVNSYSFDDPFMAYYILERLDVHEIVAFKDVPGANFTNTASALKPNFEYCNEHRAYFVNHPESIFKEYKFVSNFWKNHKIRSQVINVMGQDLHPEVVPSTLVKSDLRVDAGLFFMRTLYFYWRQIGKQYSCLTQASNHIPGHDKMYKKEKVGQSLVEYAKTYQSRPQCFNYNKYFPKTWVLKFKDQCLDFFKEFNSPYYQDLKTERNVVYFRKIGADVHQGQGVFPVTDSEEVYIRNKYQNGTLCGIVKENNLIQYNVWNSLLVQKRKPGFRVFMLVASVNPVIAYYHDGYVRLSLNEYDPHAKDKGTFVTNIHVNIHEAHDGTNPFKGMTEEQINEHTCWFYDKFHKYLMEEGIVTDPNWVENYLRAEFKKVMIHFIRMSQSGFVKKSSVFELYGLDFVMDDKLGVWFIEANTMPLIDGFTPGSTKLMNRMLGDTFEIIYGLLRSRVKRIIAYVNMLTPKVTFDGMPIPDIEQRREEFRLVTMNKFEPEFLPSPENTFHPIVDENQIGTARYANMLDKKCL